VIGWQRMVVVVGLALAGTSCGVVIRNVERSVHAVKESRLLNKGRTGALTAEEREWATVAWQYFDVNQNPVTGMVGGVEKSAVVTMWQVADYLAAAVAAHNLDVITTSQLEERAMRVVSALNSLPLYDGLIPNRFYNTQTLRPVTDQGAEGLYGWSAVDLGRLLLQLRVVRDRLPYHAEYVDKAVLRWNFCSVVTTDGILQGGVRENGGTRVFQEGRLGYEEYASAGYRAWGFIPAKAADLVPFETVRVLGVDLAVDGRDPRRTGTPAPVVSAPWILLGVELGFQDRMHDPTVLERLADAVYLVQERRYREEHIVTARTDHPIGRAPHFVYDSLFSHGYPFNTVTGAGEQQQGAALVSTRAAFGLWVLWNTSYTTTLMKVVRQLSQQKRGWFEGRYEATGGVEPLVTASTNAMVLEALSFKVRGRLYVPTGRTGYFEAVVNDPFKRTPSCLPQPQTQEALP
jgi:hypothetical protein